MGMLTAVLPPPTSKASAPATRFNEPEPSMFTKLPGVLSDPLKMPAIETAEFTVTMNGVVTVVLPAEKSAA